jgi:hypothetical protein
MNGDLQPLHELEQLLTRFLAGAREDISLEAANRIEGCIAGSLPEDDELQDLADSLAEYRPDGGEYLYSYKDMRPQAEYALQVVRRRIR